MPPIQKVKSLLCICLNFVAKNIDTFPTESLEKEPSDSEKDDVNVPFSLTDLPCAVLRELSIALRRNGKQIYREFLHLLLVPNLRRVDLSVFSPKGLSDILPLVARKCPDMTSLFISGHDNYDYFNDTGAELVMNFHFNFSLIQTFAKLEILYLSKTASTSDNCLDLLGSNCKELRKLYVFGCPVTDAGISGLCVIGECKLIEYLDLRKTKVTSEGVIMALQNLSSLTVLRLGDTVIEALHEIHQLGALENKLNDLSKFSLSNISISAFADIPWWNWKELLKSTVSLCPSISQVDLYGDFEFLDDDILLELLPLEKLEHLSVEGLNNADCLLPFLKKRGSSLKHLHIGVVHEDYIPLIAQYCPNLRSLSLINVRFEVLSDLGIVHDVNVSPQVRRQRDKLKQPIFKYLEKLKIFKLHEMLRESICLLLFSPSLKYVEINFCDTFTDDVLKRATNAHSFPNLVSFEMSHCELATHNILDMLLQDSVSNHLNSIKLEWLEQKEPSNFDQIVDNWRKMKEKNRWDLKIWLCYEFDYVSKREGPFEYSSDEETDEDEDEIVKNKIIII